MKKQKFTRYCNPGNYWDQCQAEKWGCPIGLIKQLTDTHLDVSGDAEVHYQAVRAYIEDLKARGYTSKAYCSRCTES